MKSKTPVLIIDDKADALQERLYADEKASRGLSLFTMNVKARPNLMKNLGELFRFAKEKRYAFEFVLLGLSLAEAKGMDLAGYQIIKQIRRFYPKALVVVYSHHDDIGSLARAFRNGAAWFIRKNEIFQLPEILKSLRHQRKWRPEWRLVKKLGLVNFEFESCGAAEDFKAKFDEKRQYLTYKCMEYFPGKTIHVRPLGGGFSTSATFKAVKGKVVDGVPLQTPVIIKIDSRENTMMEYERYYRFIRPYILNDAGRVEAPERVLDQQTSAIVYSYAGSQNAKRELRDLKSMILEDMKHPKTLDFSDYSSVFDQLFDEILPKLHRVSPEVEMDDDPIGTTFPNSDFWELDEVHPFLSWNDRIEVPKDMRLLYGKYSDCYKDILGLYDRLAALDKRTRHPERYVCRVGIVHGDVNFANVMVERQVGKARGVASDAWLIDFARTRRDSIEQDYCVMFTAAVGLWFASEGRTKSHIRRLMRNFSGIIMRAVFAHDDELNESLSRDRRIVFIYRILRRIRAAAIAQGVQQGLYAYSVVMALMVAFRIQAKYEKNEEAARGMIFAAKRVMDILEEYDATC